MRRLMLHILNWMGWKIMGDLPPQLSKAVLIMAPHTSNWDFFYGIMAIYIKKIPVRFLIKKEMTFSPFWPILKILGAIPVERRAHLTHGSGIGQVSNLATLLTTKEKLLLIIAPEGTRSYTATWKTGFYYIALEAQVPIVLGYLDYTKKEVGIGPTVFPTGGLQKDLQKIKEFYRDKVAKHPNLTNISTVVSRKL